MFDFLKRSLQAKITLIVTGVMVMAVAAFSVVFFLSEQQRGQQDAVRDADIFSRFATQEIYDLYIHDYNPPGQDVFVGFGQALATVLNANTDTKHVQLVGINGRILFDSDEVAQGHRYSGPDRFVEDQALLGLIETDAIANRELSASAGSLTYQVVVPVRVVEGVHTLSMVYSFSFDSLKALRLALITRALVTSIPLLLLAILIPMLILPGIVRPLRVLTEAASRVSSGDYSVVVTTNAEDEIGVLARTFTHMLGDLKKSNTTLTDKISELERLNKVMITRELRMVELKQKLAEKGISTETTD